MPSLSEQIAELAELRHRAKVACNETCRLIREFHQVCAIGRAGKANDPGLQTGLTTLALQQDPTLAL